MPPLRKMPPLAAAATECRFRVGLATVRRDPATAHPCSVRLHGDLVLTYLVRAVGGRPRVVRQDPPRRFDRVFYLYDPDHFFRSYQSCGAIIHQMLAQTPVICEFDLADDKWDHSFLPHDLSMTIVGGFPCAMDQNMGAAGSAECCVCLEDFSAPKESSDDTVMLPCSHVFHSSWFHRVSTCPIRVAVIWPGYSSPSPGPPKEGFQAWRLD